LPAAVFLTVAVVVLAQRPSTVWSQERPRASGVADLVRQLDHDDYRQRDAACDELIALVRKQPDVARKRVTAIGLVEKIREHFFTKYEKLPEVMVEEESDHGKWITDSFERVHANRMAQGVTDYVEIAFEDVLCRIRGLRLEALYGRKPGMVAVDAGRFLAGSTEEEVKEVLKRLGPSPYKHWVRCAYSEYLYKRVRELKYPFYVSRDLVDVGEFSAFLSDTGARMEPGSLVKMNRIGGNPVCFGFDIDKALRFARWSGRRFLCEDEWEKAARGMFGRRYAHGNHASPAMHLERREGAAGSFPCFDDFIPLGIHSIPEKKRDFFTSPFGARTLGLLPEVTVRFVSRHQREPPQTFPADDRGSPPDEFPPRCEDACERAWPDQRKWRSKYHVVKGGTVGLASTDELYPRAASRGFFRLGYVSERPFLFFRCALDIPSYGRKLQKELQVLVCPQGPGEEAWQATPLVVKRGDGLSFRARGAVIDSDGTCIGPSGLTPRSTGARASRIDDECALIGMVEYDLLKGPFFIGTSLDTIARDDGELMLKINRCRDKELSGEFVLTVRVYRK
jgi:formylglycine-generating enzyme required for sulfatase activity